MQENEIKIDSSFNLDVENEFCNGPSLFQFEHDYGISDIESNYMDFIPTSILHDHTDLKFHELSPLESSVDVSNLKEKVGQVESTSSETCEAAIAIEANIPTPEPKVLMNWRNFINSAYYHPNIIIHYDVSCLKELFQLLGSDLAFQSVNIMIDMKKESEKQYKPSFKLRPEFKSPPLLTFAQVKDFSIDKDLQLCIVKNYSINASMKNAISEMVDFIIEYPEALYLERYGFIVDFFLKFGVHSQVLIDAVMRTQRRRMRSQKPASVLVLKQASRLGKRRKEFLQQKIFSTPEKKYDPIVPYSTEPVPVRQLRNRRIGSKGEESESKVPHQHVFPESIRTKSESQGSSLANGKLSPTKQSKVTRKLFNESPDKSLKPSMARKGPIPVVNGSPLYTEFRSVSGRTYLRKQKRFYNRRDNSVIEKSFPCSVCSSAFAYKGNLVLHMKKKHSSQIKNTTTMKSTRPENYMAPFKCPLCPKEYSTKYKCKTHIVKLHTDQGDLNPIANNNGNSARNAVGSKQKTIKGRPKLNSKRKVAKIASSVNFTSAATLVVTSNGKLTRGKVESRTSMITKKTTEPLFQRYSSRRGVSCSPVSPYVTRQQLFRTAVK